MTILLRIPSLRKFLACVCDDNFIPPPCDVIAPDDIDDLDRRRTLSALYSHMHDNRLPYQRVGRSLRFDTRELDAWMRDFDRALTLVRSQRVG